MKAATCCIPGDAPRNSGWRWRDLFGTGVVAGFLLISMPAVWAQNSRNSISAIEELIRSQQYDQALTRLKTALRGSPGDFKLWTLEGVCLALQSHDREALVAFDHAIQIAPNYTPALRGEVEILYRTGDQRAIPLLKRMLKADPGDTTGQVMLGMLQTRSGDCGSAVSHFAASKDALANDPTSLEAYGYCLYKLNRPADAIPIFRQLISLLPDRNYLSYDLAVLLEATHDNKGAVKVLEPLLTPGQADPDLLSLASQAYEATGDTPKAVALQRQAIIANPADASNYVRFAVLCLAHDSFQVGIDMLNAGIKRISGSSSLYLSRGVLNVQLGEFSKAEADFKMAEQLDRSHNISVYAGDLTFLQRNDPESVLAQVRRQLKAHPQDPLLRLLLAQLIMMKGPDPRSSDFKEALQSAQAAARLKPDLVEAHDQLAGMYMNLARFDEAIRECRIALQYDPSNETAMYHLVISERRAGRNKEELQPLIKRLAELHQESLRRETDRKRYRLVEGTGSPAQMDAGH
jgi:tetratricopeptide (TPR) repeat protein